VAQVPEYLSAISSDSDGTKRHPVCLGLAVDGQVTVHRFGRTLHELRLESGVVGEPLGVAKGSFRPPPTLRARRVLAISVAQVDQMSGGRVELGVRAGWYEAAHAANALPFPDVAERFDGYEEQLAIITGMWNTPEGELFNVIGKRYTVLDSPGLPRPVQRPRVA
jgi:hypothetical protein